MCAKAINFRKPAVSNAAVLWTGVECKRVLCVCVCVCVCVMWCSHDETGCHFGRQVARRALEVDLVAAKTQGRLHATTLMPLLIHCLLFVYVGG